MTREDWLNEVLKWTASDVFGCGEAPSQPTTIRASVGWPSAGGLGKKKRVIGQCWAFECSTAKYSEIFISPVLGTGEEVLPVLIHEIVHAAVGVSEKHRGQFIVGAKAVGLLRPWTATTASDELKEKIDTFLSNFEPYPHARLDPTVKITGPTKPQKNRQLKMLCTTCGYIIRAARSWIEQGMPTCHCGGLFALEKPLDDEGDGE